MKSIFHVSLVNDPFEDPSVYVDIPWERRALLFDLGANYRLPTRKLLKVSDVFVSHTHIDHFIGFDHLLRLRLARDRPLRLFGPAGMTERVAGKLSGYTWNLVEGYPFVIEVVEVEAETVKRAQLPARDGFHLTWLEQRPAGRQPISILDDSLFTAEAVLLDHRIPCLAYSISERLHVNIHREGLEERGLPVGEWLRDLKEKIRIGQGDDCGVPVPGRGTIPLGELRNGVVSISVGQKIVYVVDVAFQPENIRRILDLSREADLIYCGAPFLDCDGERAAQTRHLTARQAGWLARQAGVKRLEVFHFSPRYEGDPEALIREAEEAFRGEAEPELPGGLFSETLADGSAGPEGSASGSAG